MILYKWEDYNFFYESVVDLIKFVNIYKFMLILHCTK